MAIRRGTTLLALTLVLASSTRSADADEAVIVTGGTANEHDRNVVGAAATAAMRDNGWSPRPKPLTKKESESLFDCRDSASPWTCVPSSLHASGVYHAFILAVENKQAEDGAPIRVITGKLIATDTQAFVVKQRHCVQCADDKISAVVADLVQELLRDLAVREGHTIIEVSSTPTGAQILLDGRFVRVTNASLNTFPGTHVIIVEKPGYQREIREVAVSRGKTAEVAIVLQPSASDSVRPVPHPSRVVPSFVMGVGAAAITAGIVLYAVDEDRSPTGGKRYWNTAPAGVAVGAAGVVAAGVGAFLWFRASKSSSQSAPSAAFIPHGALLAWSGSF